jgi:hypothetical protein
VAAAVAAEDDDDDADEEELPTKVVFFLCNVCVLMDLKAL